MLGTLLSVLLFGSEAMRLLEIEPQDDLLIVSLAPRHKSAQCPLCGKRTRRVHSRYLRKIHDLPIGNCAVLLQVWVRRFFCGNRACSRRIFAERLPQIAQPRQRRSIRMSTRLQSIALALGGNAGERLCHKSRLPTSASSLLRLLHRMPPPCVDSVTKLGVDDWAFRKGHRYGTILVDLETGKAVDLLADREQKTLVEWLQKHPEIEVISRDRNASYAEAAREGAPQAVQVADRWHLLHNLCEVLERVLLRHHGCLIEQTQNPTQSLPLEAPQPDLSENEPPSSRSNERPVSLHDLERQARRSRKKTTFEEVHDLAAQGLSKRAIASQTGLSRTTIHKYLVLKEPPERVGQRKLSAHWQEEALLRWNTGCHNLKAIHRELQQRGFRGSYSAYYDAMRSLVSRDAVDPPPSKPPARRLSPRTLACQLLKRPQLREEGDLKLRERLGSFSDTLSQALQLADQFARMVRERCKEAFADWLDACKSCGIGEFTSFARSLQQDQAAVEAALSLSWSNGTTEGNVNRLKFVKRQMYGRASFQLLRTRVVASY